MVLPTLLSLINRWLKERKNVRIFKDVRISTNPEDKPRNSMGLITVCCLPIDVAFIYEDYISGFGISIHASDPKFFTKLGKLIEYVYGSSKRFEKWQLDFKNSERNLLNEMLGI